MWNLFSNEYTNMLLYSKGRLSMLESGLNTNEDFLRYRNIKTIICNKRALKFIADAAKE